MFTDVLRSLRKKNGDTQESLAAKINVPVRTYASWERSERVMPNDVLVSIADLYGVTVDYLLGRDEPPEPPHTPAQYGPKTMSIVIEVLKKLEQLAAYEDGGIEDIANYADDLIAKRKKGET